MVDRYRDWVSLNSHLFALSFNRNDDVLIGQEYTKGTWLFSCTLRCVASVGRGKAR